MNQNTPHHTFSNIPDELKDFRNWLLWRLEDRGGKKPTKTPYSVHRGHAKVNDPATWASYDEAVRAYEGGGYSGIGFVFNQTPYIGMDFDGCLDGSDPIAEEAANMALEATGSYAELSPSGNGLHIICKGKLPKEGRRSGGIEMYGEGSPRYFTMTGKAESEPRPIMECQAAIDAIHRKYIAKPTGTTSRPPAPPVDDKDDRGYLDIGMSKDAALMRLWRGDWRDSYPSESEADMALMNKLAYWTNNNAGLMEAAFHESPHYQCKDEKHAKKAGRADYVRRTIEKAIAGTPVTARTDNERRRQTRGDKSSSRVGSDAAPPQLVKAADVPYEPPRWLIPPYFQRGKGTLIQADNGTGKTAFMCAIAAHVSTGRPLLDIPIETPGDVLILSVEDDLPILRGRIEASGGDLDRCHFMTNAAGLTFNSPKVEEAIKAVRAKMVIFDPFQAFLGAEVDMNRSNQTRPELAKLFEMSDRNDCSVAIIAHMSKGGAGGVAVNRALGSVDVPAAMRSILQIIRNPEDENECVAVHIKCSNAPRGRSIKYTIGDRGGVRWNGFSTMTAEDLTVIVKRKEKGIPYEHEPLVQVFNHLVTDKPGGGFWSYEDLKATGMKILGFPPFSSTADLKAKLSGPLTRELQERDGLIVTHGHQSNSKRGIRIEQYQHPTGYQLNMPTSDGMPEQ